MFGLDTPLVKLVGSAATKLSRDLELRTADDLLHYYPRRWVRRGELTRLRDLRPGEFVTVYARVQSSKTVRLRPKLAKTDVVVTDGTDNLTLSFFNQRGYQLNRFTPGTNAFFAGKVEVFRHRLQLTHPEVEIVDDFEGIDTGFAAAIVPIYPATKHVSTMTIRRCVQLVLAGVDLPPDPLLAEQRDRLGLIGWADALRAVHQPGGYDELEQAKARLRFDEAFVLQLAMAQRRATTAALPATPRPRRDDGLLAAFDAQLPFELTTGQREIGDLLFEELALQHPMHRLLQGEVGSGKTLVALRAMLAVVDAGGQAALLAPTEVLAQQHARSIRAMLGPLALRGQLGGAEHATAVVLLTGSTSQAARRRALLDVFTGDAGIVIGTHALLQESVSFGDLGLVVVDEQHRFGVEQRDALRAKAAADRRPHVLVMTATPIPRTIAMTVYGDLEVSTLTELPRGRGPIATHVAPVGEKPWWYERVWARVREEVAAGRQAYVVCPRVGGDQPDEPDDTDEPGVPSVAELEAMYAGTGVDAGAGEQARPPLAVLDVAPELLEGPLAGLRVEVLHGRLPAETKDAVMRAFAAGEIDVLVATTVIEVGVDVPNATAMVVLDADRFGISQLHQLRGRVGRGGQPSICLLVTYAPPGTPGRERLGAVAASCDGFALSELDLEQRREGTILGERQHGRSDLKLLSLARDRDVVETARVEASELVAADPQLQRHPQLAAAVDRLRAAEYLEKA